MSTAKPRTLVAVLLGAALCLPAVRAAPRRRSAFHASVVKIHVTHQKWDYALPWQMRRPTNGTGTGFFIERRRLLTNAHVVSDARYIEVQKDGDDRRFPARVQYVAHDCDLAILSVDDPRFYEGVKPLAFAPRLPRLDQMVTVLGYPLGGHRLSVTRGVVSRIDYGLYAHSGVDHHLVLQVDAAINPGNSGGPVLESGRVIGLAFQGLSRADNIGYAVPLPVIRRFLRDIEDGRYDGYPELGIRFLDTRNPALRRKLRLPDRYGGVAVYFVDPFGSAAGTLREGDVLLAVESHRISGNGNVLMDGANVLFLELLERRLWGEQVTFEIWRDGASIEVPVALRNPPDPFVYRNLYDERPRYSVYAGLVFAPLTREYAKTLNRNAVNANVQQIFYFIGGHAKTGEWHRDREEFVVLIRRLPHAVNTYADPFLHGIVERVNGQSVRRLEDVRSALDSAVEGCHELAFLGMDARLVLDADAAQSAHASILGRYGISAERHYGDDP